MDASANVVQIAGSAVSTSTAQLGVNVVNLAGTASAGVAGYVALDWGHINAPTTAVDLSGTTIKNLDGNTVQTGDSYARLGAPAGASVSVDIASVQTDTTNIKTRIPAALTGGGNIKADSLAINGSTVAATQIGLSGQKIGSATVGTGSTTTSIVTSACTPSNSVAGQFTGRVIIFDNSTTTTNLRGQATVISTDSGTGTFTVTALTTAPVSGDTFTIT